MFGLILYFVSGMDDKLVIVSSLALAAFNLVVSIILIENDGNYRRRFGTGSYRATVPSVFVISFLFGIVIAFLVVLPALHRLLWAIIFVSAAPYAALMLFTLFYFIFAFNKRR